MSTTAPATGTAIGAPLDRIDGPQKVTGTAPYAYEHRADNPLYLYPLHSDVARGCVARIDAGDAEALPGVIAVISHQNAPTLADTSDRELSILQSDEISFRGQYIGAVVAETFEIARHAASLVDIFYDEEPHDVAFSPDRDDLYTPDRLNAGFPTDTEEGDVDEALSSAAVTLDETYSTPLEHNNPMEPHTTIAHRGHRAPLGLRGRRLIGDNVLGFDHLRGGPRVPRAARPTSGRRRHRRSRHA